MYSCNSYIIQGYGYRVIYTNVYNVRRYIHCIPDCHANEVHKVKIYT